MDKYITGRGQMKIPDLGEGNIIHIAIAIVLGLLIIAFFLFLQKRRSGRRDFLLMGLCESGKTAIFSRIVCDKFPLTFTSSTVNSGHYVSEPESRQLSARIVDIPGHYRVRDEYFDTYKKTARCIIFVVDSTTAQKEIRDVADVFYNILSDDATATCSILVLCNKQDLATAKSPDVIRNILEKEINIVRDTRSRKLESTTVDNVSKKPVYVGKEGRDFEFSHLQQNVEFCEFSAKTTPLHPLLKLIDSKL